jgi:hypothetical protein
VPTPAPAPGADNVEALFAAAGAAGDPAAMARALLALGRAERAAAAAALMAGRLLSLAPWTADAKARNFAAVAARVARGDRAGAAALVRCLVDF